MVVILKEQFWCAHTSENDLHVCVVISYQGKDDGVLILQHSLELDGR